MLRRRTGIVVFAALAAIAVGVAYRLIFRVPEEFRSIDPAHFEAAATEMVVKDIVSHAGPSHASVYFLALGYRLTPPGDSFLEKFAAHQPPIKSYAASRVSLAGDFVDAESGRVGVMIQIAKIERIGERELEIEAALSNLPAGSNRFSYRVVQRDGLLDVDRLIVNFHELKPADGLPRMMLPGANL
jgi:hypothetical protein